MIDLHLIFSDTFRFNVISIKSWVKRMISKTRAAHLYNESLSTQALVKRVCIEVGIRGRYEGFALTTRSSRVSWYMLITLSDVVTKQISMSIGGHWRYMEDERASDAKSASLKRPGKNQVMERSEDSNVEIVETLLMRNSSYLAFDAAAIAAENETADEHDDKNSEGLERTVLECDSSRDADPGVSHGTSHLA
jgi:hypothetical protein